MSETEFDKFIKRQKLQVVEEAEVDWDAQRNQWLKDIQELYALVEWFLKKYISSGDIELRYENLEVSEEKIGSYVVQRLVLKIGPHEVIFKPIGAIVIGAKGRIDLIGPKGTIKFVLVPKEL